MAVCACCLLWTMKVARRSIRRSRDCVVFTVPLFFSSIFLVSFNEVPGTLDRWKSVLGWTRSETPPAVPVRGHLVGIPRLMKGDCNIGRGSKQRGLTQRVFANRRYVCVQIRWCGMLRCGLFLVAGWCATALLCRSATQMSSQRNTCASSRSQTRLMVGQQGGEERASRWESEWGARPGRSATPKVWRRQEGGLLRTGSTQSHSGGVQQQSC